MRTTILTFKQRMALQYRVFTSNDYVAAIRLEQSAIARRVAKRQAVAWRQAMRHYYATKLRQWLSNMIARILPGLIIGIGFSAVVAVWMLSTAHDQRDRALAERDAMAAKYLASSRQDVTLNLTGRAVDIGRIAATAGAAIKKDIGETK